MGILKNQALEFFLSVRSNVLLVSPVQFLHPDRGCDNRQSTGSTTRVNRQINSLTHLGVDSVGARVTTLAGFPLTLCLLLDSIPGQPVSSTALRTSVDSTDGETCNLGIIFSVITLIIGPLVKRRRSLPAFYLLFLCLCVLDQKLTELFSVSQPPSSDIPPPCDRTRNTRSNCHRTSLACCFCPSVCRLSCLLWSWQGHQRPWATPQVRAHSLAGISRASVCFSGESMDEACTAR